MIDSGATANFIDKRFLPGKSTSNAAKPQAQPVYLIDGSDTWESDPLHIKPISEFHAANHTEEKTSKKQTWWFSNNIGLPWLKKDNPEIGWKHPKYGSTRNIARTTV